MTYLTNFIYILTNYSLSSPMQVFIIILIVLMYKLIKYTYKYKISCRHKIHYPALNVIYIVIYISYYIGLMLFIRYKTWGSAIDLKLSIQFCKEIPIENSLLVMLLILVIIQLLLLMIKFRLYLLKELRKRYIFGYHHKRYMMNIRILEEWIEKKKTNQNEPYTEDRISWIPWFDRYLDKFEAYYSFEWLFNKIYFKLSDVNSQFTTNSKYKHKLLFIVRILPKIIIILLFIYDCYFNYFVITKVFYYLPFYIMYSLWFQLSEFLTNTDNSFNRIIYERYYQEDNVLYLDATKEEEAMFEDYLRQGLSFKINPLNYIDFDEYWEIRCLNKERYLIFMTARRYVRYQDTEYKDRYVYFNDNTGDATELTKEYFLAHKNSKED